MVKVKPNKAAGLRLYDSDRGPVPSVTEIMKVIEKPWYAKARQEQGAEEYDAKMNAAAVLGTRVHAAVVKATRGEKVAKELKPYVDAADDFMGMHVSEVIKTELSLTSDKHGFGGTLDLYCRLSDGSYAVVDWKTTSGLTREHGLQVAAYAVLLREHGYVVNKRLVVRIKKEKPGKFYARTYADHKGDWEAFKGLMTYWYWLNRQKLAKAAA